MSSFIISKPAGALFKKSDFFPEIISDPIYYISIAYAKDDQIHIKKFSKAYDLNLAWEALESLTDYSLIAFFYSKKEKVIENNIDNLCPVRLNDDVVYVAAGDILSLRKQTKKKFTDVFFMKQYMFDAMMEKNPYIFFSYAGCWLVDAILPSTTALAFIRGNGEVSIINKEKGFVMNNIWFFSPDHINLTP